MASAWKTALLAVSVCAFGAVADAAPRHRALLIGINDYAVRKHAPRSNDGRDFLNLGGAVNDIELMRDILTSVYHYRPDEIVTLKDQTATRGAILNAIDDLLRGAQKGDVLLFYFSGHGSQVKNSLSDEHDGMDESIVPADAPAGADDIRDKELRRRFWPALERGARLTIILDSCHSGSGVRGLPGGGQARVAPADMRDVKDGYRGPKLEDGGALILSAARDTDVAFETLDDQRKLQGVFSWAWARAVRDAAPDEPAIDTFQRAAARMRFERPDQVPVIAGNAEARLTPFLGTRKDRQSDRVVVAVRSIDPDGVVTVNGGWANGLTLDSELRPVAMTPSADRLQVIALEGMTACKAKIKTGSGASLHSGSLLELVAWAAPPDQPLRIWVPRAAGGGVAFARALAGAVGRAGVEWLEDPTINRPASVIRWSIDSWERLDGTRRQTRLGCAPNPLDVAGDFAKGAALFVQLPASPELSRRIALPGGGVQRVERPQDATYILTGRLIHDRVEYAWIYPSTDRGDQRECPLPLRTEWHDGTNAAEVAAVLNDDLRRLQRIHLWQTLPSPPAQQFNYRLGIRRARDNALITDETLTVAEAYGLVLREAPGPRELSSPRFVYVFVVDSYGKSVLLFPRGPLGSVENRFPPSDAPHAEIRLGAAASFIPQPPFGTDTYFLLSTDEALPDPWILEWDGVRAPKKRGETPLERLLLLMMSDDRGVRTIPPVSHWSIERLPYSTVEAPPSATPTPAAQAISGKE
jgi:hypothetical protein